MNFIFESLPDYKIATCGQCTVLFFSQQRVVCTTFLFRFFGKPWWGGFLGVYLNTVNEWNEYGTCECNTIITMVEWLSFRFSWKGRHLMLCYLKGLVKREYQNIQFLFRKKGSCYWSKDCGGYSTIYKMFISSWKKLIAFFF